MISRLSKTAATVKPAKVASLKTPAKKKLSLNEKQVLVGDYPKILDLRKYRFETEIILHLHEEFELAEREGRPPQPNISVSDSDSVEVLHFSGYDYRYAVVENLPNLKELHVHEDELEGGGPSWLICQNLPRLEKIVIDGAEVRWLQLKNVAVLNSIDVSGCEKLDYFSIKSAPKLKVINVDGCIKLREVLDLNPAAQKRLGVRTQIQTIQKASRRDLRIYKNMTITDIDMVLANINRGVKVAAIKGLCRSDGFNKLKNEAECHQFDFGLLRPLEHVYTGGTGESYCYEFLEFDGSDSCASSLGIHEPEDSIGEALSCIAADLALPYASAASNDHVLAYLNRLVAAPTVDPAEWVKSDDAIARLALAANPLMPAIALEYLANDKVLKVRQAVAENPATPDPVRVAVLNGLVKSKNPNVLEAVARHTATPAATFGILAKNPNSKVLVAIAENLATPDQVRFSVLKRLARDSDPTVRLAAAKNSATTPADLKLLAKDKDQKVRQAAAENPATPEQSRVAVLKALTGNKDPKVLVAVARNPATPAADLVVLSKNHDPTLLEAVAGHPATPAAVLKRLAKNVGLGVRISVAQNPATPTATLDALAKDEHEFVRQGVAANPATSAAAFEILVRDESWHTRLAMAENLSTPATVFETLATDQKYMVCESVAKNPSASGAALEILAKNNNDNIRMYVFRNLESRGLWPLWPPSSMLPTSSPTA